MFNLQHAEIYWLHNCLSGIEMTINYVQPFHRSRI